ncbi:hypothetical protein D3C71_880900 [compost metagenome]
MGEFARRAGIGGARAQVPTGRFQLVDHHVGIQMMPLEVFTVVTGAHQLDEAHAHRTVAQELHPLRQFIIVAVTQQYRIELDRLQA